MKIKAIVKRPDEAVGHMTNISNTLKNFQRIVDGPIEVVRVADDVLLIMNEEGKFNDSHRNFKIPGEIIFGEVAVVGVDGDEFADVPIDLNVWKWLLKSWGNAV